jgi:hypothetical protein
LADDLLGPGGIIGATLVIARILIVAVEYLAENRKP